MQIGSLRSYEFAILIFCPSLQSMDLLQKSFCMAVRESVEGNRIQSIAQISCPYKD